MKKAVFILLKLAITTGLLWMIFREPVFRAAILQHVGSMFTHWPWTLAGLGCVGLSTWLGALRWQVLLKGQQQEVSNAEVVRVTFVSNFFNITSLGVVGGDAYRVLALMHKHSFKRLPLMVSVMLDHMLGMVGLSLLFLTCRFIFSDRLSSLSPEVRTILEGFEMFMIGSLVLVIVSAISFTPSLYNWGEKQWPRMLGYAPLKNFATACDALRRDWRGSILGTLLSIVLFVIHFLSFYCAIYAVGGTAPLMEVLAAMPIVDTVAGLPFSVSGLGVREKTFETLIHALTGLPQAMAISASLVGWLMGVVWGLIGGLIFISGSRPALVDLEEVPAP
ncbi:MAG: lysylphosphatidylglycerol synthase transmembrane domain-containing protein [Verrucomicrobia bacterium]|nr:lysylphosphatidylglycerol synthase transmembrane domain-containing protein [Verrucomicrobiota bacterium]